MILAKRVGMFIFALGMLGLAGAVAHAQQQWNGAPGPNGKIWRPGQVAVGLEPTGGGDSRALFELTRPLSGEKELLFSARATFKDATSDRFEIDTERAYAGGARSKANLLYPDIDFAVHRKAVIGTASLTERIPSGYALAVGGKILAEEVRIKLIKDWADHVFEPDYRLKSLPEVEAFIRDNHRLPDIPSAADVAERGIDLGRMQSTLLAKIEELTLYVIEQKKDLETLRGKVTQLEQENTTLRPSGHR